MKRAVLIAGPTASGKSQVAMAIAERLNGVVVNADSMQVYRDLQILSARPGAQDETRVPHRLYGCVPAGEVYSTGRWLGDVAECLDDISKAGKLPVIVGGTGLYFHALLNGLAAVPDVPEAVRAGWRGRLEDEGAPALHRLLTERDPDLAARLEPADGQRILRGLEVLEASGRRLSDWQEAPGEGAALRFDETVAFALWPPRDVLYRRCDARFDAMMEMGALEEVKALKVLDLSPDLPAMKALGVPHLMAFLDGACDLADAVRDAKTATRRYAKRQMTWFRRNMIAWNIISEKYMERNEGQVFSILRENELTGQT